MNRLIDHVDWLNLLCIMFNILIWSRCASIEPLGLWSAQGGVLQFDCVVCVLGLSTSGWFGVSYALISPWYHIHKTVNVQSLQQYIYGYWSHMQSNVNAQTIYTKYNNALGTHRIQCHWSCWCFPSLSFNVSSTVPASSVMSELTPAHVHTIHIEHLNTW